MINYDWLVDLHTHRWKTNKILEEICMSIKQDNRHLYLQVIDKIKQDISAGVYREHEKLPSEFVWAKKLGVSRATLREALRILEEENVIIRRHGVGTFVNSTPTFSSGIEQLNSVTDMIRQANMTPGTIFLSSSTRGATEEDVRRFNCQLEDEFLVIERVRTANGEPVVYCVDQIPVKVLSEDSSIFDKESLLQVLEEKAGVRITYAVADIEPIGYHDKVSPILECSPETSLLLLKQTHYDSKDQPYLHSSNFFKADKFRFHVLRKRY